MMEVALKVVQFMAVVEMLKRSTIGNLERCEKQIGLRKGTRCL